MQQRRAIRNRNGMIVQWFKTLWLIGPLFLLFLLTGCGQKGSDLEKEMLIRVGDRVVTVLEFEKAFEIAKTAYAHNGKQHPEDLQDAKLRLLNELTVEMILLKRAQELGVTVTDAELERAVADIKGDYPQGEFEKTLLEFVVSYESWENRLKRRLIMEKVIEKELKNRTSISPEDIAEYYHKNYRDKKTKTESLSAPEDINEIIVRQLHREKAEDSFKAWIEELKAKYEIEINIEQWEKIAGSKSIKENEPVTGDSKSG